MFRFFNPNSGYGTGSANIHIYAIFSGCFVNSLGRITQGLAEPTFFVSYWSTHRWRAQSAAGISGTFRKDFTSITDPHIPIAVKFSFAVETDKSHTIDGSVQTDQNKAHAADAFVHFDIFDKSHSADAFVHFDIFDKAHAADAIVQVDQSKDHAADAIVQVDQSKSHSVSAHIDAPGAALDKSHSADAFLAFVDLSHVKLIGQTIPPITDPLAHVKSKADLAQPSRDFLQALATLRGQDLDFVGLKANLAISDRDHVKLGGDLITGAEQSHTADTVVALQQRSFVQLQGTLKQTLQPDHCGNFPDVSYIKTSCWLVEAGFSVQAPGTGMKSEDDWLSSQVALSAYSPISRFVLDGINLVVTAFTTGVISFQTRTRQWLRRVDAAPGGIILGTEVQTRTLANGQVITTTTTRKQVQDTQITIVEVVNSLTPNRVTITVTELSKSGKEVRREIKTLKTLGETHTLEKRTVQTTPPDKSNIQPIKVTTLDGELHYQFFGAENPNWPGGDQEGTTETETKTQIVPSSLNGETVDQFGNPILAKITDEKVTKPTGEIVQTHIEEVGIRREAGTTVTDVDEQFDGIQTTTKRITTFPDGSQEIEETVVNNQTGDSVENTTERTTDEFGRVTITVTNVEKKTFPDPVTGKVRTTETRTTTVTGPTGDTTESTVVTNDDFEDDIITRKVKVFLVQEFTINCVIDRQSMEALLEKQIEHQKNFALLELFGQQLGNANLSWGLRQNLIEQFEDAMACLAPLELQALGKTYEVVFASSASSFRAKYIPGTQPPVFELQLIVQERSDLVTGTKGF